MNPAVPWRFAARVGGLVAGDHPLWRSYHAEHLALTLPEAVETANRLVAEETRLDLPGIPDVAVVDRREWIDRNLGAFTHLLRPLERKLVERLERVGADDVAPNIARRLVAAETGALLGFLARRVLGQYELVLPTGDDSDSIAFVGPNVLQIERLHQLNPKEMRTWLALHEATHRAQFVGVPWMRTYFRSLVDVLVEGMEPDPGRLIEAVRTVVRNRKAGRPLIDEKGLLGLMVGDRQRQVLDRVQALMSLLEGHGHVVMDRIGARILVSQPRMSRLLKARRRDPRWALLYRLTGLEMKIRQYEQGERFVRAVETRAGWDALEAAWVSPDNLPTLAEIEEPEAWLRRVG